MKYSVESSVHKFHFVKRLLLQATYRENSQECSCAENNNNSDKLCQILMC
jgi:hypothetical protein